MSAAASTQPERSHDPTHDEMLAADSILSLTSADLTAFDRLGISPDLLVQAHVQRVTDAEAREKLATSKNRAGDMQGIMFPYISPVTGYPVSYRIRRDHPEIENGRPKDKYLSAYGCKRTLYYPPNATDLLKDTTVPLVLVEAEKSVLALTEWAKRTGRRILALGMGGCWGWRGRIGKAETSTGHLVDEVGALPDLKHARGRLTYILLDANAATNPKVQQAREALAKQLRKEGADIRILNLPTINEVNGPDDYIAAAGDDALAMLFDAAAEGPALLDDIASFVRRYVSVTAAQADAVALWIVHTHALEGQRYTPYLEITSAEKQSGKSSLLEVLSYLVQTPWKCDGASVAALFRKVDQDRPTMLYDESDASFKGDPEYAQALRGFLNSGNHHRGSVARTVGKGGEMKVKDFSTFCPKAIAGIGRLPDTVSDRSIPIRMERKLVGEKLAELRERFVLPVAVPLRNRIALWVSRQGPILWEGLPEQPASLSDRQRDAVEPLLAIADAAGGEWPERARRALVELLTANAAENESIGVTLLRDIKGIFEADGADKISSAGLVEHLKQIETSPWAEWNKGRGLTTNTLASMLKKYRIYPRTIRVGTSTPKGYQLEHFEDAFGRYFGDETLIPPNSDRNTDTRHIDTGKNPFFGAQQEGAALRPENWVSSSKHTDCGGVGAQKQEEVDSDVAPTAAPDDLNWVGTVPVAILTTGRMKEDAEDAQQAVLRTVGADAHLGTPDRERGEL